MNALELIKTGTIRILTVDAACGRSELYHGGRTPEAIIKRLGKEREDGRHWACAVVYVGDVGGVEMGIDLETFKQVPWNIPGDIDERSKAIVSAAMSAAGKKGKGKKKRREGFDYAAFSAAGVAARKAKKALKEKTIYKF